MLLYTILVITSIFTGICDCLAAIFCCGYAILLKVLWWIFSDGLVAESNEGLREVNSIYTGLSTSLCPLSASPFPNVPGAH